VGDFLTRENPNTSQSLAVRTGSNKTGNKGKNPSIILYNIILTSVKTIAGVKSRNSCRNLFMMLRDSTPSMRINIYINV
jgi:hypothetical protein